MNAPASGRINLLERRGNRSPTSRALVVPRGANEFVSYADLARRAGRYHEYLKQTGIQPGERLGVIMNNRPAFVALFFAALRAGVAPVLLHARGTGEELRRQFADVDGSLLVCESDTEPVAAGVAQEVPVLSVDDPRSSDIRHIRSSEECTARTSSNQSTDQHLMLFTSGTTGRPRPVLLTWNNLLASARASGYRLGHLPSDVWYDPLPVFHMGGLAPIVRSVLHGSTVLLTSFEPDSFPSVLQRHHVTGVSLVPTMLRRALDAGTWDVPDTLRFVLLGGAPATEDLIERARQRGIPVFPTYGMTETASQITTARPPDLEEDPRTVGVPLLNTTVSVRDGDGRPCDPGETGDIYVSGPTVMEGYFERPKLNERVFSSAGFRTGDRGHRDETGRLYVSSDRVDRIVTGGENVDPEEVRRALLRHPGVESAVVCGVSDPEWGEKVVALVTSGGDPGSSTELKRSLEEHLEGTLATYKHPKDIRLVDTLPRTPKGTPDREKARRLITDSDES